MSFIAGVHGTVAALLICCLLFADEAGVPLPFAPSELLLLLIGVLISGDAFPAWAIMLPVFAAMFAGMMTGYSWARAIGPDGLAALASRLGASSVYQRAQTRLTRSSPWQIGIVRLIPGLRPHATLVSGAARVDLRTFLLGALPALAIWESILVLLGITVGLPVALFLGRFERLAVRGVVLVALGIVVWLAIREASTEQRSGLARMQPRLRASLALVVDATLVGSIVLGVFAIGRRIVEISANGWVELCVAGAVLVIVLLVGRGGQTPGETLFSTQYWQPRLATTR